MEQYGSGKYREGNKRPKPKSEKMVVFHFLEFSSETL